MPLSTSMHFSQRALIGIALLCIPCGVIIYGSTWIYQHRAPIFSYVIPESGWQITLSRSAIQQSLDAAQLWLWKDFNVEGFFNYEYDPRTGTYAKNINIISELLASRELSQISARSATLLKLHTQNLQYIFEHAYRANGPNGYIVYNGESDTGANGIALLVLAESPLFNQYKDMGTALASAILSNQKDSGELSPVLIQNPKLRYPNMLLSYYSYFNAEAIIGLLGWYEKTGDTRYRDAALKAQDFYMNKYLALGRGNSLLVQWQILSLSRTYDLTHDTKYRDALLSLSDVLLALQKTSDKNIGQSDTSQERTTYSVLSADTATYSEALIRGYRAAKEIDDQRRMNAYRTAIFLAIYKLTELQYTETDAVAFAYPQPLLGGIHNALEDPRTQLDGTVQTISALSLILETF